MMKPNSALTVSRSERRWVTIFALLALTATTIPYLLGYAWQTDAWHFTGFVFALEDGNTYIAKMLSGAAGHWLFYTPYTSYPQNGVLLFLPYLLLGKLTSGPGQHEQLVAIYQIYRWLAGLFLIHSVYEFIALFVQDIRLRKLGTAVSVMGGGLGWLSLLVMRDTLPLDFYSPESFGFLAFFGLPHLALGRGLLLKGVKGYLRGFGTDVTRERRLARWNAVWWIALGLVHPLNLVMGGAVVGCHFVTMTVIKTVRRSWLVEFTWSDWRCLLRRAGWLALAAAPFVFYNAVMTLMDPFMAQWAAQNVLVSPPPVDYLLAYGLLIPLAAFGFLHTLNLPGGRGWLVVVWVLLLPVLVYAPTNLQRRFSEGVWVALVVVALIGVSRLPETTLKLGRYAAGIIFLTPILFYTGSLIAIQEPAAPLYRPAAEILAFEYLASEAEHDTVILAGRNTSNPLPAWVPLRVVVGHGPESLNAEELTADVTTFFDAETAETERQVLITELDIRYIFLGPEERLIGAWQPDEIAQYDLIYQQEGYEIYEVIPEATP
jgi:hypothetical protein